MALTNATLQYGLMLADLGVEEASRKSAAIRSGLNTYDGHCTYQAVAETFAMDYSDRIETMK